MRRQRASNVNVLLESTETSLQVLAKLREGKIIKAHDIQALGLVTRGRFDAAAKEQFVACMQQKGNACEPSVHGSVPDHVVKKLLGPVKAYREVRKAFGKHWQWTITNVVQWTLEVAAAEHECNIQPSHVVKMLQAEALHYAGYKAAAICVLPSEGEHGVV